MRYLKSILGISAAFALFMAPVQLVAQDADDKLIATLDGVEIRQSDFDLFETLDPSFQNLQGDQKQIAILSAIIDVKSLAKQAEGEDFAESEEFKKRMVFLRERSLHNSYFQDKVLQSLSDDDVKERYVEEVAASEPEMEVRARHILVETLEDAQSLITELDGGADFEQLAKDKSTGPSGPQGGDLGFFGKGQMVPSFEEAAFAMEEGAYTKEPVKTQFGYHVIKVEEKRERPFPAFEQVQDQMRQVVLREKYTELLKGARANIEIDISDEKLKSLYEQVQ